MVSQSGCLFSASYKHTYLFLTSQSIIRYWITDRPSWMHKYLDTSSQFWLLHYPITGLRALCEATLISSSCANLWRRNILRGQQRPDAAITTDTVLMGLPTDFLKEYWATWWLYFKGFGFHALCLIITHSCFWCGCGICCLIILRCVYCFFHESCAHFQPPATLVNKVLAS